MSFKTCLRRLVFNLNVIVVHSGPIFTFVIFPPVDFGFILLPFAILPPRIRLS